MGPHRNRVHTRWMHRGHKTGLWLEKSDISANFKSSSTSLLVVYTIVVGRPSNFFVFHFQMPATSTDSKLALPVQSLISNIFDMTIMNQQMREFDIDLQEIPTRPPALGGRGAISQLSVQRRTLTRTMTLIRIANFHPGTSCSKVSVIVNSSGMVPACPTLPASYLKDYASLLRKPRRRPTCSGKVNNLHFAIFRHPTEMRLRARLLTKLLSPLRYLLRRYGYKSGRILLPKRDTASQSVAPLRSCLGRHA